MNPSPVDKIVQAVLYEGYNLYPYRPSVKNRQRWTFGGLYPRAYCDAQNGADASIMQTQCLVRGGRTTRVEVEVRFLHLIERRIGSLAQPLTEWPAAAEPAYELVDSLQMGATRQQSWQETVERKVPIGPVNLGDLVDRPRTESFAYPKRHELEPFRSPDGEIVAVIIRDQEAVEGSVEVTAEQLEESLLRLTVRITNGTGLENPDRANRDEALRRSLVSTHTILRVRDWECLSLMDPGDAYRTAAAACRNIGTWPVLVGESGSTDSMLSSPIILYDYPEIAPESPGDLFDGTEIDEILTLRIMTLTDEEKQAAQGIDERTRTLFQRTEALAREQLAGLHGAVRSLRPVPAGEEFGPWHPLGDTPLDDRPTIQSLRIGDTDVRPGDRVRLRPFGGGDIMDLALEGKIATVESIEQDYEDRVHVAVTVDDDPGNDLGRQRQPGHRFFFKPEEVEPLGRDGGGRP
jgi:hypothetical protein